MFYIPQTYSLVSARKSIWRTLSDHFYYHITKCLLTTMLKSSLCDYSDGCIFAKGTITVNNTAAADANETYTNKKVFKYF